MNTKKKTARDSGSQSRASNKYNKDNTITICLRLNKKTDADVIATLNSVTNKTGYIKNLIRNDS